MSARQERRGRGLGKKTLILRTLIKQVLFEKYPATTMSSRQVFYQCLGPLVANAESEYRRVCRTLVNMRRDATIPYDRIVDRTRSKHQRSGWDSASEILGAVSQQFRRDMWTEHDTVPVIACEKQALEGIFAEVCDEYGVQLYIIRGFNSESFDYEWSEEIKALNDDGKRVVIAYFGDHDPYGIDIEDNSKRKLRGFGAKFEWTRLGLLPRDVGTFNLPTQPLKGAKRSERFRVKFGDWGAELDSLPPDELPRRIRAFIEGFVDREVLARVQRDERVQRESLNLVAKNWRAAVRGAQEAARA